jgi:hypothetical protein
MLRHVESDESPGGLWPSALQPDPAIAAVTDGDADAGTLPQDHPRWVSDAVAISKAARELAEKLRPVFVAVRSFWDHRLRCIAIAGRRLGIDASGSYRLEI